MLHAVFGTFGYSSGYGMGRVIRMSILFYVSCCFISLWSVHVYDCFYVVVMFAVD